VILSMFVFDVAFVRQQHIRNGRSRLERSDLWSSLLSRNEPNQNAPELVSGVQRLVRYFVVQ
jgi:hypothetical protein